MSHAELLARIAALRARVSEPAIADAFVASLGTRRLDWRSALASWAHVKMLPMHDLEPVAWAYSAICGLCGASGETEEPQDPEVVARFLAFRSRGATGFPDLSWSTLDLEAFVSRPPPVPSPRDVTLFRDLVEFLGSREPNETSTTVVAALGRAKIVASNKDERAALVDTLGLCGVLRVPRRPAPLQLFTPGADRDLPPRHFVDRSWPVCWWRGADGVNLDVVRALFGHRVPF